eukprot:TRINITY_DN32221_c0_g1_i1.p1 TRINITY_DN32221_c0_g1~~TRINITY_DN32221_c0_g1_i1.p1  ORF type:complete len:317 (+),score=55.63 TRINITY_DN32221_c0_g1_i1:60-953(+)
MAAAQRCLDSRDTFNFIYAAPLTMEIEKILAHACADNIAKDEQLAQAPAAGNLQSTMRFPPGLSLRPPPGLALTPPCEFPAAKAGTDTWPKPTKSTTALTSLKQSKADRKAEDDVPTALPSLMTAAFAAAATHHARAAEPHVKVQPVYSGDVHLRTRAEWSVDHVQAKLRTSCGFPLVSPPFTAHNLPPLRFMFAPGQLWAAARGRQQSSAAKSTRRGSDTASPFGAVKLKAGSPEAGAVVALYLTLGSMRLGPLTFDFTERAVQSAELPEDWAPHVEAENDRLVLGVEIVMAESAP